MMEKERDQNVAFNSRLWRFAYAACAMLGGLGLCGTLTEWLIWQATLESVSHEAASIGIIGGADGPTAIFVTASKPGFFQWLLPVVLLTLGIRGYSLLRRYQKRK